MILMGFTFRNNYSEVIKIFQQNALLLVAVTLSAVGCKRAYQESQIIGSWQLDVQVADARVSYYKNHSWVATLNSSRENIPSGTEIGNWKLEGDRLISVTRSTFDNKEVNTRDVGRIIKLTESLLVEEAQENGRTKTFTLHKVDLPAILVSDTDLTRKLVGTWQFSMTNAANSTGALLYSTYQTNGSAFWSGTIYKDSRPMPMPKASGVWRVEQGHLKTTIMQSQSSLLPINKESSDAILFVTDSQFTYCDEQATLHKVLRIR